jgi:hypothetical protein
MLGAVVIAGMTTMVMMSSRQEGRRYYLPQVHLDREDKYEI